MLGLFTPLFRHFFRFLVSGLNQVSWSLILPAAGDVYFLDGIETTLPGKAIIDPKPGTWLFVADLTTPFIGSAAGTVQQPFRAHGDRADSAGEAENTLAAGTASFFIPAYGLIDCESAGIHCRKGWDMRVSFCEKLDTDTAGHGEQGVEFFIFDEAVQFGKILAVALPFDGVRINVNGIIVEAPCHLELDVQNSHLFFSAGKADGDAGSAADVQDLVVPLQHFLDLGKGFSIGNYHNILRNGPGVQVDSSRSRQILAPHEGV